jgi:hypothetical protein
MASTPTFNVDLPVPTFILLGAPSGGMPGENVAILVHPGSIVIGVEFQNGDCDDSI